MKRGTQFQKTRTIKGRASGARHSVYLMLMVTVHMKYYYFALYNDELMTGLLPGVRGSSLRKQR